MKKCLYCGRVNCKAENTFSVRKHKKGFAVFANKRTFIFGSYMGKAAKQECQSLAEGLERLVAEAFTA